MKKRIVAALFVLVAALGFGSCSSSKTPEEKVKHITEKMTEKLGLTKEQSELVYSINLERANGHLKAYNNGRDSKIMKESVKTWENKMKEVLNNEQLAKINIK